MDQSATGNRAHLLHQNVPLDVETFGSKFLMRSKRLADRSVLVSECLPDMSEVKLSLLLRVKELDDGAATRT